MANPELILAALRNFRGTTPAPGQPGISHQDQYSAGGIPTFQGIDQATPADKEQLTENMDDNDVIGEYMRRFGRLPTEAFPQPLTLPSNAPAWQQQAEQRRAEALAQQQSYDQGVPFPRARPREAEMTPKQIERQDQKYPDESAAIQRDYMKRRQKEIQQQDQADQDIKDKMF